MRAKAGMGRRTVVIVWMVEEPGMDGLS